MMAPNLRSEATQLARGSGSGDPARRAFVLQSVQPGLLGLMDGAVSTLAPIFAAAGLTGRPLSAFFVGLAADAMGVGCWLRGRLSCRRLHARPDGGRSRRGPADLEWPLHRRRIRLAQSLLLAVRRRPMSR